MGLSFSNIRFGSDDRPGYRRKRAGALALDGGASAKTLMGASSLMADNAIIVTLLNTVILLRMWLRCASNSPGEATQVLRMKQSSPATW